MLETSIQQLYQKIEQHWSQQEWKAVIKTCQQALDIQPSLNLYKTLGVAFQMNGQLETSLQWYLKALELQPDDAEIYSNIASICAQQKQWQDAILNYQVALRLNPNLQKVYSNLGYVLERLGQPEKAVFYYHQLIHLNPDAIAYQKLGDALFKLQRWEDAISAFRRVLELEPNGLWSCLHLGKSYLYKQQWQQAIETCLQALKIHPQAAWSYKNLGDAFSEKQEWANAVIAYIYAVKVRENPFNIPFTQTIYQKIGYAISQQIQQSTLEQVTQRYDQIFHEYPEKQVIFYPITLAELGFTSSTPQAYLELAETLVQCQQFTAAMIFYQLADKIQPHSPEVMQKMAQLFQLHQQFEAILAAFYHQIEQQPELPEPYTKIGNLLTQQGQGKTAISYHQKALILKGWHDVQEKNYQFTQDWFSHNIPIWEKHLKYLSHTPELQILEIGSYQGMSTCWFLDFLLTHPTARITCIDPYFKLEFNQNIQQTGSPEKVIQRIGYSQDILSSLPTHFYDIVYIDGCHQAMAALQDALYSWCLTKVGGILIFDDYEVNQLDNPEQQAKVGIDYFLNWVSDDIEILHQGYQLMIKKTATGLKQEEIATCLQMISISPPESNFKIEYNIMS